ncbi:MAG TPA: ABC transporter permease [Pyrinomonadaceae bacterium]|nr:ABC transporter permease [Pyrinomonadaceae bacterium]
MRRTLAEIGKELNSMRHDVTVIVLFLILPLFQVYAWSTSPSLVAYGLSVAVQDLDRTPLSQEYTDGIRAALSYEVIPLAPEERYEPLLDRGEARGAVVIPENFQRDFYAGKTVEVQWVIDGTELKTAGKVKSGAAGVTNYVMAKFRPPGGSPPIKPQVRYWFNPGKEGLHFYAPGAFVIGIALFTPIMVALSFSRQRAGGATLRVFTSNLKAHEFLIGKIAAYSLAGLLQAVLCFAFIMQMFKLEPVGDPWPFLCGTVIYTICNVTIGAFIGVIIEGEVAAIGLAKTYGMVLTFVFSGQLFPLSQTPYPFGWLPDLLPATHFNVIVRDYFQRAVGWRGVWDDFAILIALTLVAFFFAWRRTRKLLEGA